MNNFKLQNENGVCVCRDWCVCVEETRDWNSARSSSSFHVSSKSISRFGDRVGRLVWYYGSVHTRSTLGYTYLVRPDDGRSNLF